MKKHLIDQQDGKMFIGVEKGKPVFIDYETQRDESGRGIAEIILDNIPEESRTAIKSL